MKPPIALGLLTSTLACNKASPLGASLCNTYKNNNIPTGAGGRACEGFRSFQGLYMEGMKVLEETFSFLVCSNE